MRHLDLFSGIGGFALAASWAGHETVQFCEIDPFARAVLAKNFPGVPIHEDIRTLGAGNVAPGGIDLITGGFPCQPWSVAGKRRGAEDDRHLWPEMVRVIDEVRPRWCLGENVAGFIPMALDDCLSDLESIGYEAWPVVVPACAVGAWHRRDRVWIIAHREAVQRDAIERSEPDGTLPGDGEPAANSDSGGFGQGWGEVPKGQSHASRSSQVATDAERCGEPQPQRRIDEQRRRTFDGDQATDPDAEDGRVRCGSAPREAGLASQLRQASAHSNSRGCEGGARERNQRAGRAELPTDGNDWWESESRLRGVPDGLSTGVDQRPARLKALGNAIVPQVAYEIIRLMD